MTANILRPASRSSQCLHICCLHCKYTTKSIKITNIMQIPEVDINYFGTTNEKQLKRKVTEFVKQNLVGKKITFSQKRNGINLTIELTWQGLKNDINEYHPLYIEKLVSFAVLDKILKNAKYIRKELDKRQRDNIVFYKFFSKVKIKKITYDVWIVIKKSSNIYIYDHILIKGYAVG